MSTTGLYQPYQDASADFLYNLLFCDDLALFLRGETPPSDSPLYLLHTASDLSAVAALADDTEQESRIRALAYNLLREKGGKVPAKLLLGVIFEVPLEGGLDTLAVFSDNRIRYINQTGKILVMEAAPPDVLAKGTEVLAAAQEIINQIGPWDQRRLPPPTAQEADIRMTFLVSDGLYFGQGGFEQLGQDAMSAPLIQASGELLQVVVDAGLSAN